jgi:hypothetical protein
MAITPLTDLYIDDSYSRLVQTNDARTEFADGLGRSITFGQTPTGSLLLTASAAGNTITFIKGDGSQFPVTVTGGSGTPGGPNTSIQFNKNGAFSGSSALTFNSASNALTLSGSLTVTGSITSTSGFTGSLQGTSSWAYNALTSSYPIASTGSTLYSTSPLSTATPNTNHSIFLGERAGDGAINANSSNFIGYQAGKDTLSGSESNMIGTNAGYGASNAVKVNFIGNSTGQRATNANASNFIGYNAGVDATDAALSNFIGFNAGYGASNAAASNFLGYEAGNNATNSPSSNFFGPQSGNGATNAMRSNFIGQQAGGSAVDASGSNFIGYQAGYQSTKAANSILLGYGTGRLRYSENAGFYVDTNNITYFETQDLGSSIISATTQSFIGVGDSTGIVDLPYSSNYFYISDGFTDINVNTTYYPAPVITNITYNSGLNQSTFTFSPPLVSRYYDITVGTSIGPNNIVIGTNISVEDDRKDSINIGGILFGTGSYADTDGGVYTGPTGGNIGINVTSPTRNFEVSGSVAFTNIKSQPQLNVLTYNSSSGQLYYTASSAIGGGGGSISTLGSSLYSTNPATSNFDTTDGIFFGGNAGAGATNANHSIFLGAGAGASAINSYTSNFIGYQAGNSATNAHQSNFLGYGAGLGAGNANNSNFFGRDTGQNAFNASYSTLIGYYVGKRITGNGINSNNIIIGTNITLPDDRKDSINLGGIVFATGSYSDTGTDPYSGTSNGRVGINVVNPQYALDVSGSGNYSNELTVTGSLNAPNITGSLQGTASYASTALWSSYPISVTGNTLYSTSPAAAANASTNNNIFLGINAGATGNVGNSNFLGNNAGGNASNASNSNFFGNFTGQNAYSASQSNFFGNNAGYSAASASNSNFFGQYAGYRAVSASYSTLIGYKAGLTPTTANSIGSNNIVIGTNISLAPNQKNAINIGAIIFATGSYSTITNNSFAGFSGSANGRVGINQPNPQYSFDVSGSGNFSNGLVVTSSLDISGSFTVRNLVTASVSNVLTYNPSTGQVYYTASSAIGGGGGGPTSPGDGNGSVQFNSNGVFSGSSNFTFNSGSNALTLSGSLNITGSTTQVGDNTLLGNTLLSGSITISGSTTVPASPTIKVYGDMETNGVIKFLAVNKDIDTTISGSYIYVSGSTNDLYFSQNGAGFNNNVRLRWIEGGALYTGLLRGGVISSTPGTTTFKITSGSGLIVTLNASTGSEPYPTVKYISWPDYNAQPITYSGSAKITYVGISSAGTIIQQTVPWGTNDIDQWDNSLSLGVVLHLSGSVSTGVFNAPQISYGGQQKTDDFFRAFGPLKISGHTLQASGSTLGIQKTGGTSYREGANYIINPNHPSTVIENAISRSKIYRYYLSGSTPVIDTGVGNAGYTEIDPTKYVDTTTGQLTTVFGNNSNQWRWTIQRVFWVPNSPTNAFIVYYGNAEYTTLVDVKNAIDTEPFSEAPNTSQNAIFIGYILVRKGCTDLSDTTGTNAVLVQGGLFRNVGGNGGSGTAAATSLGSLSDVSLSNDTPGDLLVYGAAGEWNNAKQLTGSYGLTGSLIVTQNISASSFTGSLFGTATTASYITSSFFTGTNAALSASYAATSSYAQTLTLQSTLTDFYSISPSTNAGVNPLFTKNTGSFTSAFGKYTVYSGSNSRAGEFITSWNGTTTTYYDNATTDIGSTSGVVFTSAIISGQIQINTGINTPSGWQVKMLATFM